jgi:hypothetical protein
MILKNKILISTILFILPFVSFSQQILEFNIGTGQTAVDIEYLVEQDEIQNTVATDWGLENYGIGLQYFFYKNNIFRIGTELMYQYQYWYSVKIPNTTNQYSYRTYNVESFKITPILRVGSDILSIDIGPEFNFNDGLSLGLLTSFNYNIKLTDKIFIPLKLRVDVISGEVVYTPISLNTGICIKI